MKINDLPLYALTWLNLTNKMPMKEARHTSIYYHAYYIYYDMILVILWTKSGKFICQKAGEYFLMMWVAGRKHEVIDGILGMFCFLELGDYTGVFSL